MKTGRAPDGTVRRPSSAPAARLIYAALAVCAVAAGVVHTWSLRWTCDDAFITLRYADNFVRGLGLVYNAGERVEGYTHFLWLLLVSGVQKLGADPVAGTQALGIVLQAAVLALWAWIPWKVFRAEAGPESSGMQGASGGAEASGTAVRAARPALLLPATALALAAHSDFAIWGTGGLETPLFTLLLTLSFYLLVRGDARPRRALLAGVLLFLAVLTRPDGILFWGVSLLWLLWERGKARGSAWARQPAVLFLLPAAVLGVPYAIWKLAYYGNLLPNPYYVKSGGPAWWGQGFRYLWLYARGYPASVLFFFAGAAMLTAALLHRLKRRARTSFPAVPGPSDFFRRPPSGAANRALFLALSFTLVYALFFIARVGGDFMYARFVIPLVPFLYFSGECFLRRALRVRPRVLAAALVAVPLLVLGEGRLRHALYFLPDGTPRSAIGPYGVTDERWYYTNTEHGISLSEGLRDVGSGLARYFEGTNVRVLLRSQATLGYYGRFATCIESNGLTDATIARTPSVSDRPGHQKLAPRDYLARRGVHFVFLRHFEEDPWRSVYFRVGNEEVRGELITWDAALMHRLRERFPREVRFTDFDQVLDRWIADAPGRPAAGLRRDYERFREFYFLHNPDPEREAKILRLLAGSR